ncbi:polysaccharide deacetylase family protein [Gemmatimonas sp.]|uniref:polysaccharide deacetylase family protein n=2 Tax=Gemmatimonas sp. TaxID=1962908 RepID=UPI00356862B6
MHNDNQIASDGPSQRQTMFSLVDFKSAVFRGAQHAGMLDRIKRSNWRRTKLLILCYHGVSLGDEHEWSDLYVSPERLQERLRLIQSMGFEVASLDSAVSRLWEGTLKEPTVVLTFDDGTADFAIKAAPLLEQYAMPATVHLTTYYARRQLPVFDTWLAYLLWKGAGQSANVGPFGKIAMRPTRGNSSE